MPSVTVTMPVSNSHTAHIPIVVGQIDLALLLSEHYGKMIRQGQNFTVTGFQAGLLVADNHPAMNIDKGLTATVDMHYIPTVKHSRRAWNNTYKMWRQQKNLRGVVGGGIRYDDLEFAWSEDTIVGRTSTIFMGGMGDSDEEKLVLTGVSQETILSPISIGEFSLKDYYNSAYETAPASKYHETGTVIKEPKWGSTPFPETQHLLATATNTAAPHAVLHLGVPTSVLAATSADAPISTLPESANVLCGLIGFEAYIMPDEDWLDDEITLLEDMNLQITIFVRKWKPLTWPRRSSRKSAYRGRKYRGKRRYSRKRK